ncbi:MAG: mechanosensitive ion channel family protein [Gemmatimonadota bacterium]|nr:mechanosensitive ion channel family protein [Gemmatimonadota bacterium]
MSLSVRAELAAQDAEGDTVAQAADSVELAPVPDGQEALDELNQAELRAVFDRVQALSGIDVTVEAGVVTLAGEVPDGSSAERAVELAQGREGVVYVDDSGLASLDASARIEDVSSRLGERLAEFVSLLPLIGVALVIIVVFCVVAWAIGLVRFERALSRGSPFLGALIQRLVQFALVVTGLVIALELLDATALVGAVIGTAGLAGLALGFAFKDIAENYLAGVIMSLRYPFAEDDYIEVGGHSGKVVRLSGRETILMTLDGNHVQMPNATVFREPLTNYTRNPLRRFTVEIGVASATILSDALDVGLGVLFRMEGVVDEPAPQAVVWGFGDSTMQLRFTGWVDQRRHDYLRVKSEAIRLLKVGLEDNDIELPEPEYRVYLPDVRDGRMVEISPPDRDEPEPGRERPKPRGAAGTEGAQRDVSVDRALDEQIEADRRAAEAEDGPAPLP